MLRSKEEEYYPMVLLRLGLGLLHLPKSRISSRCRASACTLGCRASKYGVETPNGGSSACDSLVETSLVHQYMICIRDYLSWGKDIILLSFQNKTEQIRQYLFCLMCLSYVLSYVPSYAKTGTKTDNKTENKTEQTEQKT